VAYLDNHGPEKFATIFLGKGALHFAWFQGNILYLVYFCSEYITGMFWCGSVLPVVQIRHFWDTQSSRQ
jgi:hypothetical protein